MEVGLRSRLLGGGFKPPYGEFPEFLGYSITWEPVSSQGLFERSSYVQTLQV